MGDRHYRTHLGAATTHTVLCLVVISIYNLIYIYSKLFPQKMFKNRKYKKHIYHTKKFTTFKKVKI